MNRIKVVLVGGARPNFMKLAPIVRALQARSTLFDYRLVHTGQHHDHGMSQVFFDEFGIPTPHDALGAGGGSHAEQTAKIMVAFEAVCLREKPDLVVVVGDVNSTLAAAIVAKKLHIAVAHVEAGLRSFDRDMPEEINRLATDAIADYCFATESSAVENLYKEGHSDDDVFFVGQVMVDNLLYQLDLLDSCEIDSSSCPYDLAHSISVKAKYPCYAVLTLHRAANTDDEAALSGLVSAIDRIAETIPVVFPVHPRTRKALDRLCLRLSESVVCLPPLSYMDFLNLWRDARIVLTDSGGLQEETTALGIPCLTLRENTERPITIDMGTNTLVGTDPERIVSAAAEVLAGPAALSTNRPPLWDGRSAERIVGILENRISKEIP